jgi:hypothetical protein
MKIINQLLVCLCVSLTLVICQVQAESGNKLLLGNYEVNFTVPVGRVLITEGPLFDALNSLQQPPMEHIAYLLDKAELALMSQGQKDTFEQFHILALHKDLKYQTVARDQFEIIKSKMMEGRAMKPEDNLESANDFFNTRSAELSQQSNQKVTIQAAGAFTADPHVVGRNLIGQTTFVKYRVQSEEDEIAIDQESIVASTSTIVYLRGKVLYLISAAPRTHSQWTRTDSVGIAQSLLDENSLSSEVEWLAVFGEN